MVLFFKERARILTLLIGIIEAEVVFRIGFKVLLQNTPPKTKYIRLNPIMHNPNNAAAFGKPS